MPQRVAYQHAYSEIEIGKSTGILSRLSVILQEIMAISPETRQNATGLRRQ